MSSQSSLRALCHRSKRRWTLKECQLPSRTRGLKYHINIRILQNMNSDIFLVLALEAEYDILTRMWSGHCPHLTPCAPASLVLVEVLKKFFDNEKEDSSVEVL